MGSALAGVLLVAAACDAAAQSTPGAPESPRSGIVSVSPSLALTSFGYDTNVFYETINPRADTTASLRPSLDVGMRFGRTRIDWSGRADALLFRHYRSQQTFGTSHGVRVDIPGQRFSMNIAGSWLRARERPGFEVDTRASRVEHWMQLGAKWRVGPMTYLSTSVRRSHIGFDTDERLDDRSLAIAFNRTGTDVNLGVQHALTPLSSLVFTYTMTTDAFDKDRTRDNRSHRIGAGFEFKPLALLTGRIDAGVIQFQPLHRTGRSFMVPSVTGDIGYTLRGVTHFGVRLDRGVNYSIDVQTPLYVQTGVSGSIIHRVRDRVTFSGTVMRQHLGYRPGEISVVPLFAGGDTTVNGYDAGFGHQVAPLVSWALHVGYVTRHSSGRAVAAGYDNVKVFMSVTYGAQR